MDNNNNNGPYDYQNQNDGQYNDQNGYQNQYSNQYDSQYSNQYDNQYGNQYNNQYNNMRSPVDQNGEPLKNRFGMKLTFSILLMLAGNLISLVCGIIACVFTCKQNSAYKEGRFDEFKSDAKTSMITLWIGFGGFILNIILAIVLFFVIGMATIASLFGLQDYYNNSYGSDAYYYDYNEEHDSYDHDTYDHDTYDYDTDDSSDNAQSSSVTVENYVTETPGTGYTEPTFCTNGVTVTLPCGLGDVETAGYVLDEYDQDKTVAADDYEIISLADENDNYLMLYVENSTPMEISVKDAVVTGAYFTNYGDATAETVSFDNGTFDFTSTQQDLLPVLGSPDYSIKITGDGYTTEQWQWYGTDDEYGYDRGLTIYFQDAAITEIDFEWNEISE